MDLRYNTETLDVVFGPDSQGETPEERARTSSRIFVRSEVQLAEYTPDATGRQLSAWEALQSFSMDILKEVFEYGSAILRTAIDEPAETLRSRRESLDVTIPDLAKAVGLSEDDIADAEDPTTKTSVHTVEKIAQALALDEQLISYEPKAGGDEVLAVRLKEINSDRESFSAGLKFKLCESAWVVKKQYELNRWLESVSDASVVKRFVPSPNYGEPGYPVWRHGYFLAGEARRLMDIPEDEPIDSLRELIERRLEIPLVHMKLSRTVAGATVANGPARGIAVNTLGPNGNVWVRRVTLAHELGHLLWDPDENLKKLQVDMYDDLDEDPRQQRNRIEARANAFAG